MEKSHRQDPWSVGKGKEQGKLDKGCKDGKGKGEDDLLRCYCPVCKGKDKGKEKGNDKGNVDDKGGKGKGKLVDKGKEQGKLDKGVKLEDYVVRVRYVDEAGKGIISATKGGPYGKGMSKDDEGMLGKGMSSAKGGPYGKGKETGKDKGKHKDDGKSKDSEITYRLFARVERSPSGEYEVSKNLLQCLRNQLAQQQQEQQDLEAVWQQQRDQQAQQQMQQQQQTDQPQQQQQPKGAGDDECEPGQFLWLLEQ